MVSINGTRPNGTPRTNGIANGVPNGGTGAADGAGGSKPKRSMMHIDDATRITVDINSNWPIDKTLTYAEECLQRAESYKSFNRIDMALKEYIKATITTTDVLPRNKGWASLISDKKGSKLRYNSIMSRIDAQLATFEKIKELVKEDNARTGVQPQATQRRATSEESEPSLEQPRAPVNGSQLPAAQSPPRTKPPVQPKPRALHGNAIAKQAVPKPVTTAQDLTERFAKLQNAKNQKAFESLSLAHMIPSLPAMPAAIYSPARGTVSSHAAELPTSNQRGMFSRSSSTASFTKPVASGGDYFASMRGGDYPTPTQSSTPRNASTNRVRSAVPAGDIITVQDLMRLQQSGSRDVHILIIDVRNREDFDEGHIMSQATICIEPDILQRENISATQIAESMILAPASEIQLFEKRHEFDLVILYDQNTDAMPIRAGSAEENAILALCNALSLYDYDGVRESEPRKPKLLKGGVDAWIDVVGPGSLQSSSTAGNVTSRPSKMATLRSPTTRAAGKRRISTIQDADEARSWENHVKKEMVRSTEDFLRRYPEPGAIQESMTSPVKSPHITRAAMARIDYSNDYPSPPQRPERAVPRHSHAGLPDDMDTDDRDRRSMSISRDSTKTPRKRTGLVNPHQWCYANSMLQAIFGSGDFAKEYIDQSWAKNWPVPMKPRDKIKNPQLLCKILANLFHWMQNGNFETMQAKTLMEYINHIDQKNSRGVSKYRDSAFGGPRQQDSQEFLHFVMEILHDETNKKRDQDGKGFDANVTFDAKPTTAQLVEEAIKHWKGYSTYNDSIIDRYWRSQLADRRDCTSCGHSSVKFGTHETYPLSLTPDQHNSKTSLIEVLKQNCAKETRDGYKCDHCKNESTTDFSVIFGHLPDRFCLVLSRYYVDPQTGNPKKNDMVVEFPITGLNMKRFALQTDSGHDIISGQDFVYDLYATIVHSGSTTAGGHYKAYVKDDPTNINSTEWTLYNDSTLSPVQIGGGGSNDKTQRLYDDKDAAYLLFYQRRGTK